MAETIQSMIEDTLEAVLQQQLISPSFRIYDRLSRKTFQVPGTKAAYTAIKNGVMEGFRSMNGNVMGGLVDFLVQKFQVPRKLFDERLAGLPVNDNTVDARLKFMMVVSALREHWQNIAYEQVLTELKGMVVKKGFKDADITRDMLNQILSTHFGQDFSHLVNLYVVRLWGIATRTSLKIRSPRLTLVNHLVASIVDVLKSK